VRDLSSTGALLEMTVPPWLPCRFELRLDPQPEYFDCEIRHVRPNAVGVVFHPLAEGAGA
jgi:hypothetical protein